MANFDYYAVAQDLISRLEAEGRTADAEKLWSAIDEGATGTEIFMALRFYLLEITKHASLEGELQLIVARLLAELNRALG
jgi:hypothetical protein